MCDTGNRAQVMPAEALPASMERKAEVLPLEPDDELSVLMVCDNVTDILLPDQGPAKRLPLAAMARLAPLLAPPPGQHHPCWLETCWAYKTATSSGVPPALRDPLSRVWRSAATSTLWRSARAVCPQSQ